MSSSELMATCPAMLLNILLTTPSDDDTETNFAQTKEPFDITSNAEFDDFDDSEGDAEIDTTKNNLSDPTDNNSQSPVQIPEPAEPPTPPHTSTPSESSDPTTDELLQYAFDIALFAVNPDSHQERLLTSLNQEMEDLARLRVVITRKPVVFMARGPLAGMGLKIEDLPEWVISPVVEQGGFEPIGGSEPIQGLRPDDESHPIDEFPSLAPPQYRNDASVLGTLSSNAVGPRAPFAGMGLRIEDLPEWAISPVVEQDGFKFADGFQPVDGFQSVVEFQPPSRLQSLTSPQQHIKACSLGSLVDTPLITKSSPLNLLNRAMDKNYLNIIHGGEAEWDISSSAAEELFQPSPDEEPLPIEEEQNNDTLIPLSAPILENLSTPDLSEMDLDLPDDMRSLFQVLPKRSKHPESSLKSLKREEMNERFIIGDGSENPRSLIVQGFVTPSRPITLSEQFEPRIFRPRSVGASSPHNPPEIAQQNNTYTNIDIWPTIALALGIPILPSHLLTPSSLQALGTTSKQAELEEGYLSDELHQWALHQHRIFVWINSGALDNGIDGIVEEPVIFSQGEGLYEDCDGENSENSVLWDYEDVESFARSEPVHFRRNLEWIQGVDVEGEKGSVCTLPDEVYNFSGDEEFIHRSVSEPVEESNGWSAVLEEYYEKKRNVGEESKLSSSSNQSLVHGIRKSLVF
ncbi:hypothetical protein OCU04_009776 [Sclerotinia nivalis]|uniref:Uncharacterized protein n=1 Tax=Sclerotinia nivalis TaxID=352851 RepID=A0A9X0AJA1_9HELO|nr:hypothetical protein OCU04_009776 [Sclerotinia nivalis]